MSVTRPSRVRGALSSSLRPLLLPSAIVAFESAFYSAITPLLPTLKSEVGLGATGAGVVVAGYPGGMVLAAVAAGWLTSRQGARRATVSGLSSLAIACLWFGWANDETSLVASRILQGVGGALCWTGVLAWVSGIAPDDRRATAIGTTLGIGIIGVLVGPLLGLAAVQLGRVAVFLVVGALAAIMAVLALHVAPDRRSSIRLRGMFSGLRGREAATALWVDALTGLILGAAAALLPLRLADLGFGSLILTLVFVGGGLLQAIVNPVAGHAVDRNGWRRPTLAGLLCSTVLLSLLGVLSSGAAVLVLTVLALPSAAVLLTPAIATLERIVVGRGVPVAAAFTAGNLVWALGEAAGSAGGPWLMGMVTDGAPWFLLATLCCVTATAIRPGAHVARRRPTEESP